MDMDEHLFSNFNEDPFRSQFLDRPSFDLPEKQREYVDGVWQKSVIAIVF
jgi:hypothetical protein